MKKEAKMDYVALKFRVFTLFLGQKRTAAICAGLASLLHEKTRAYRLLRIMEESLGFSSKDVVKKEIDELRELFKIFYRYCGETFHRHYPDLARDLYTVLEDQPLPTAEDPKIINMMDRRKK